MATYLSVGGGEEAATNVVKPYPSPEASYEQVSQDASLFTEKLKAFHSAMGTHLSYPIIWGSTLDLHNLFVQVTSRGGLEKVIKDRRWREVISAFNVPSAISSASFVLRKYYLSHLYHFEQVYYFRKTTPTISLSDTDCSVRSEVKHGASSAGSHLQDISMLMPGFSLIGVIEGKSDSGYCVSVNVGSEELKGVLFHPPDKSEPHSYAKNYVIQKRMRRRSRLAVQDPSRPKPNRSGYTFFFAEQYARLKASHRGQERAIGKQIGHLWSQLSEAEKQVYQDQGLRDKERYRAEMNEYRASRT